MRLAAHIIKRGISRGKAAQELEISGARVTHLCAEPPGWPSQPLAVRIERWSQGEVMPNDFLPAPVEAQSTDQSEAAE